MKKTYSSKDEELFFDFLPDEVFNSLTPEQREYYREYRRYHHFLHKSKSKVEKMEKQIQKLKTQIKNERDKWGIRTVVSDDIERDVEGWKYLLTKNYSQISHLDKKFKLRVKMERRNRSSRSYKVQSKQSNRYHLERVSNTYKGEPLKKNIRHLGRVISVGEKYEVTYSFGDEQNIRDTLSQYFGEGIRTESLNRLELRLRQIIIQYTRYCVFHNGWGYVKDNPKTLNHLMDWVRDCDEKGIDRKRWE